MSRKNLYAVAYDITDDRKRAKAADILKNHGSRVQKSLFECRLDPPALNRLLQELKDLIDAKTDSVIAYRICGACAGDRKSVGMKVFTEEEAFRVL